MGEKKGVVDGREEEKAVPSREGVQTSPPSDNKSGYYRQLPQRFKSLCEEQRRATVGERWNVCEPVRPGETRSIRQPEVDRLAIAAY